MPTRVFDLKSARHWAPSLISSVHDLPGEHSGGHQQTDKGQKADTRKRKGQNIEHQRQSVEADQAPDVRIARRTGARWSERRSARHPPCPDGRRWCRSRSSRRPRRDKAGRQSRAAENRCPAHERAPGEGKTEEELRPVGKALGEGIDRHDRQRQRRRDGSKNQLNCNSDEQADQRLQHDEDLRLPARDLAPTAAGASGCAPPPCRSW